MIDRMDGLPLNMSKVQPVKNSQGKEESFDFSKPGESIHFIGDYVVKYFANKQDVALRIERAQTTLRGFVPEIAFSVDTLFGYRLIEGKTMYATIEEAPSTADTFFDWCRDEFWNADECDLTRDEKHVFQKACHQFYYDKTIKRVDAYWEKVTHEDVPTVVNSTPTPALKDILEQFDWENLTNGIPSRIHGDLQFDNVIVTPNTEQPFVLIDWRGDFGGLTAYGDIYYDLAKLYGGLIIAYSHVKKGRFEYAESGSTISIELPLSDLLKPIRGRFEQWIIANGFDLHRIQLLTGLIFLNMSPLHHSPFDSLLHHLGKATLIQVLSHERA
ncbi:MAG: phosphotransferase [Candidatus Andersenbacteria bacterium]